MISNKLDDKSALNNYNDKKIQYKVPQFGEETLQNKIANLNLHGIRSLNESRISEPEKYRAI
jgi:hypothetical protein